MAKITIVGAGQSGLLLGCALVDHGYDVQIVSNRTPDQIQAGRVMSSQCIFADALAIEDKHNLNFWRDECEDIHGFGVAVTNPEQPGQRIIDWKAKLDNPAQSVDQRLKMPVWIEEFEKRGGKFIIEDVGIPEMEKYCEVSNLVILSAGKGDVVKLFERDAERSLFSSPQRAIALTYHRGAKYQGDASIAWCRAPGVGEYVSFPALTVNGPCEIVSWFGNIGGPMDCWDFSDTPEEHMRKVHGILETYFPWEADRCKGAELTDPNGYLSGAVTPAVRKPVLRMPSGAKVLGMGDAVIVNDPITGQGSNTATKAAEIYLQEILKNGDKEFTELWMQETFESFWLYAKDVINFTSSILLPPEPHLIKLLDSAGRADSLASTIVNGFNHPPALMPWMLDPVQCDKKISEHLDVATA